MVDVPSDLSGYNVIIAGGSADTELDVIRTYVEDGGGYVFMSAAAQTLDFETNSYWLGARSFGYEGLSTNATVSTDHPLGADLLADVLLMQQAPEESGAIWVELEPGAERLAQYGTGNTFAYSYEFGDGRVYFQASTDHGIAGDAAESNLREILKAGIVWATSEFVPEAVNLLPEGTAVTTGNEPPSEYFEQVFADQNPQSLQLPLPSSMTKSIFVAVTSNVANAILFFDSGNDGYRYNVPAGTDALLTFASELNITEVTLTTDGVLPGSGTDASATVGYVTVKSPPICMLPPGASLVGGSPIPTDSMQLGSPDTTVGSILDVSSPAVPIKSMFVGFDESDVIGYAITFQANGVDYSCPVLPATIEISFDEPAAIVDVKLEKVGPWGTVGYSEPADGATAYAKFIISKITTMPGGFQLQANVTAPDGAQGVDFSAAEPSIVSLTKPVTRQVAAIWISAGENLIEPYLYFRSGNEWYSTQIDQGAGTLISFSNDIDVDELYGSVDGAVQNDQIMIGYVYPISVDAHAGLDQSVQELQAAYLDGSASVGPSGGLSYAWTQVDGPTVVLQGANTASPSFSAPAVGESGARLSFKLTVTDSNGQRSVDVIVVTVVDETQSPNQPPSIGSINDSRVSEGSHVVLAASAFDPDGEKLKYSWLQKRGPAITLVGANTATLSFIAPEVTANETLSFELTVVDEEGNSAKEEVLVFVRNVPKEILVNNPPPIFSAGSDQIVTEGSVVVLQGKYEDSSSSYNAHWEQVAGVPVTLSNAEALNASFKAPAVSDGEVDELVFQLSLLNNGGSPAQFDRVAITVNSAPVSGAVPVDESNGKPETTSFAVSDPGFIIIQRTDIMPPDDIYSLAFRAQDASMVLATQPSNSVVGIWLNTTASVSELKFHFSYESREYFIDTPANQVMAYVFDDKVSLEEVGLSAVAAEDQVVQIGYYYDEVPLASPLFPAAEDSTLQPFEPVQVRSLPENTLIGFAARNTILAGALALGVPAGIAIALKMVSKHRRSSSSRDPAKLLFPKNDPIAGEAEKVRPVIEELERMLGRNLDTALNASELLDRFGSGKNPSSKE